MRDRILDAASNVFSQKGYHKACMDDIALEAGVAKGSLYYHFHNKSQLFRDVAVRGIGILRGELTEAAAMDIPIERKIASLIDRVSALCFDYSGLFGIMMSGMPEGIDPEAWRQMQEARAGLLEYIAGLLRDGCETEHAIRPMDFAAVTQALLSFILAYCRQYPNGRGREKVLRELREVVMRGIMA